VGQLSKDDRPLRTGHNSTVQHLQEHCFAMHTGISFFVAGRGRLHPSLPQPCMLVACERSVQLKVTCASYHNMRHTHT
jgi:hypothetical protein